SYKEPSMILDSNKVDWFDRNEKDDDHYTQPGKLYKQVLNKTEKESLVSNIVAAMKEIGGDHKMEIMERQLCHFFRADPHLGGLIAEGLNIKINPKKAGQPHSFQAAP
ncbi:MAG TPA: catalase-related domain-containing protein, partial [Bacteroidia bacterium]|nr:catalase-related domain-containing protein [Bacteroidia bacterium]